MMSELPGLGRVTFIEKWGSDERIIEAARMSTGGGFKSWEPYDKHPRGDQGLLEYLYQNNHATPFEMGGMVIEVEAPIFVFREWHRHRTQSYNEMSARYMPLPNRYYVPSVRRIIEGAMTAGNNKQAQGTRVPDASATRQWLHRLENLMAEAQDVYEHGLEIGVPKELARCAVTVNRMSHMRASANLRNWLGFMTLRCAPNAQWEIRQYADAVSKMIQVHFPRTHALWEEGFDEH
jgi:thymidylate synthase (FAD)